ncbi:MAG: HAD-IB family phosphatase [Bacilli bacterium]|nr:HAD-IB family phosphatase [Bacilli bacterium]
MIINPKIKEKLPIHDLNNLYVVTDFDRTITNGNSKTSWSILASSNLVPKSYISDRQKLYDFYRPIEVSNTVDYSYKLRMVKEWFQKHIELFVKYKISKDVFDEAATNLRVMEFRPYAKEFIEFLHQNNIPLIIISAGIGNFIESFLKHNNCNFDNVYISSNKILFKDKIAVGVNENIIHSFNKNEVSLPNEISEKIKNRNNILLLGDQVSDLNMIDKKKHPSVISVGFLTPDSPKEDIISNFDIVCEENDNYNDIKNLLFNFK